MPRSALLLAPLFAACAGAPAPAAHDVTAAAGLPLSAERCLVAADLDRDGDVDLLLAPVGGDGTFRGTLAVFENDGHGHFRGRPFPVPLEAIGGCQPFDEDGDGVPEIVVEGRLSHGDGALLLTRRPDGTYADDGGALGALVGAAPTTTVAADLDGDGDQDLVVGTYVGGGFQVGACEETATDYDCRSDPPTPGEPPQLLRNDHGTLVKVPGAFAGPGLASRLDVADVDGDGRPDVFVSNDFGHNRLYRNTAEGFVDVLAAHGAAPYNHGMGAALADFDGDGRLDLYVADAGPDQLWKGTPAGPFVDVAPALGIAAATRRHVGWNPKAADFDGDGRLDVLVPTSARVASKEDLDAVLARRPVTGRVAQADDLFLRRGSGFERVALPHRRQVATISDALAAVADVDGDGRPEAIVVVAPFAPEVRLLRFDFGNPE